MNHYTAGVAYADSFLKAARILGEWSGAGRRHPVPLEVRDAARAISAFFGEELGEAAWLATPPGPSPTLEDVIAGMRAACSQPKAEWSDGPRTLTTSWPADRVLTLKAHVQNGRFVIDQPTDLPEGTEVQLLLVEEDTLEDLSPEARAELMQVLDAGFADMRAGRVVEGDEIARRLLARS